jgi:digeranylgeranylglycerophospholipid reductase
LTDFDVVVVGGGCAGLWSAKNAASAGARTLLVERRRAIGERIVCAEGVGEAGMEATAGVEAAAVVASIDRGLLFDPRGRCVEVREPRCGYILDKGLFVKRLASRAADSGVEIMPGTCAVEVIPSDGRPLSVTLENTRGRWKVKAGAVVAADGIESGIARSLGVVKPLRPFELFSCAQYRLAPVDLDPHAVEFHFGRQVAPGGYAWVFPKGEGVANVGVGVICSGRRRTSPVEYLERFRLRRCPRALVRSRVVGGVPVVRSPFRVFGRGVFAAGDAARVADPLSGAGIVPAMESGALSARAAVRCALEGSSKRTAEREFVKEARGIFRDRAVRFAVRKVMVHMSDDEMSRMLELIGEYSQRSSVLSGPLSLVSFMLKAMPRTFGLVRHLVRA